LHEDDDPSEEKPESGQDERVVEPPPPEPEVSQLFGPLEQYAESCGMSEAIIDLREANTSFLEAYA